MHTSRRHFLGLAAASALVAASPLRAEDKGEGEAPEPEPPEAPAAERFRFDRDWSGANPVPLPDPAWEIIKTRFTGAEREARLERLWHGTGAEAAAWLEGPVWMADWRSLIFSDLPNNRTLRFLDDNGAVSVFEAESGYANGHARDREGRLISFDQDPARVRRLEHDGGWTVLMDSFEEKPLNGPNDGTVDRDGAIWFTDPGYGSLGPYQGHKRETELPKRVYRIAPDGKATVAAEGPMRRPNGLCFSPDFRRCYVVDSGISDGVQYDANLIAFDVADGGLRNAKVFADFFPGSGDGVRCDEDGNVWCSSGWGGDDTNGIKVFAPDGDFLAMLHTPEIVSNLAFGGAKRNRLFMTGTSSLYAISLNIAGA